jgi:hypothetical protein
VLPLPAHHRPPQIEFRHGVPYYFTVGQLPDPQQIVAQLPERGGMSDAQRDFVLHIVLMLAVTGIGVCVAVGWAASRIRGGGRS